VILRLATIYGLSPRPRFDLVVNLLAAKALVDGEITIFGGEQWRPFIHVADAAETFILCLESPVSTVRGEIFNVGDDNQNYTISRVGEIIHDLTPGAKLVVGGEDVDRRNYHVRFGKIRDHLGFSPIFTVEMGVREIQEAIRQGEIVDYRDLFYSNYLYLSANMDDLELARHYTPQGRGSNPSSVLTLAANGTRSGRSDG
jgi:nucleoside-diphosphate-sugar epimerase